MESFSTHKTRSGHRRLSLMFREPRGDAHGCAYEQEADAEALECVVNAVCAFWGHGQFAPAARMAALVVAAAMSAHLTGLPSGRLMTPLPSICAITGIQSGR
jgi:hypothetical protein